MLKKLNIPQEKRPEEVILKELRKVLQNGRL